MKHPTEPQRYKISAFIEAGLNKTQIAQKLNGMAMAGTETISHG